MLVLRQVQTAARSNCSLQPLVTLTFRSRLSDWIDNMKTRTSAQHRVSYLSKPRLQRDQGGCKAPD